MTQPRVIQPRVPQTVAKQVRQRKVWDIALSIVLLLVSYAVFLIGAVLAVLGIAFTDYCPDPCHEDAAISAQGVTAMVLAVVALVATGVTIVLLAMRRRGWWVAATSAVLMVIGWIIGFALYIAAIQAV